MSKIKILSENLANQIAAGEVVERPASVVKELLENAIDAGADKISVQVAGGGARLIRVIDDGVGMDQDDVLLCLERHATSKLSSVKQLGAIETLGFRGEAVPSIASVSKLVITSRPADAQLGYRAEVRFGKISKVHEMGCHSGTVMEVSNLFGNVPARKKFLKSTRTELSHINEIITNYSLAYPQVGVMYSTDDKVVFDLAPGDTLEERVLKLLAPANSASLIAIQSDHTITSAPFLYGYLLPPEESTGVNSKLRLFVNGRTVRDRMLSHGIAEGMHGFLMRGKRSGGVIFINLPPENVDVNVHPTKQEVRFHKPNLVHDQIVETVRQAMSAYQHKLKHDVFQGGPFKQEKSITVGRSGKKDKWTQTQLPPQPKVSEPVQSFPDKREDLSRFSSQEMKTVLPPTISDQSDKSVRRPQEPEESTDFLTTESVEKFAVGEDQAVEISQAPDDQKDVGSVKVIGQLMNSYILCEGSKGLIVIDQHAAHERIIFEKLKEQYAEDRLPSQVLMFPKVIEYGPEERNILEQYQEQIERLGVDIADFGGGSYVVKAVPALLGHLPVEEILQGFFEQFGQENDAKTISIRRIENIFATIACKAAVKANHLLLAEEIEVLLHKMRDSSSFSHCPHGRPVMKYFTDTDIKKWFRRL